MDKETIVLQRKLESELKNYKDAQKGKFVLCGGSNTVRLWLTNTKLCPFPEFNKLVQQQQLLDGQYNENKNVLEELQLLKPTNTVID